MARSTDPDVLLLQAAADATRLGILRQLSMAGPVCACDLTGGTDISQPTVSHHLKVLREAGWISGERRGTWIWYSLRPDAVERFRRLAALIEPASLRAAGALGATSRRLPVLDTDAMTTRGRPAVQTAIRRQ